MCTVFYQPVELLKDISVHCVLAHTYISLVWGMLCAPAVGGVGKTVELLKAESVHGTLSAVRTAEGFKCALYFISR